MKESKAVIQNEAGIHCRPSAVIVKAMAGYKGEIVVKTDAGEADCRSIMGLLCLAMEHDAEVSIRVTGPEEESICDELVNLFETHFDFPPRESPE